MPGPPPKLPPDLGDLIPEDPSRDEIRRAMAKVTRALATATISQDRAELIMRGLRACLSACPKDDTLEKQKKTIATLAERLDEVERVGFEHGEKQRLHQDEESIAEHESDDYGDA